MRLFAKPRGNETQEHLALKGEVCELLRNLGCLVVTEHRNSDVVAYDIRKCLGFCIEIERTSKNLVRNIRRNVRSGCDFQIIVGLTESAVARYAKILDQEFGEESRRDISIIVASDLSEATIKTLMGGHENKGK